MNNVSVVLPTYNAADFISSALDSIFIQTVLPDEIVVVDDCSTDNTRELVKEISEKSPVTVRLIKLNQNSGGPSHPLNVGIEAAAGEMILTLDQDDRMRPQRIEYQLKTLTSYSQCTIAIGRFSIMGHAEDDVSALWTVPQFDGLSSYITAGEPVSIIESQIAFPPLLSRNYAASCSNFAFTKTTWLRLGKFNETIKTCNDLDFMLRATAAGPIAIINKKLFDYRWRTSSLQRRNVLSSSLEASMVRLRAASFKPSWAGDEIHALRYTALHLAADCVRKGDFGGVKAMIETLTRHKGMLTVGRTVRNKISGTS